MISNVERDALIAAACEARQFAYTPYSNYPVGAAILAEDGRMFTGVNVENASYSLTICAERTAVFKMVSEGVRRILAVAVCTGDGGSACGACRQVLCEFAADDIPVWLSDSNHNVRRTSLYTLLPDHFGPERLL